MVQFGLGYLGCEFVKNCAMMGISSSPNSSFTLIDNSKVKKCSNFYFFTKNTIGEYKNKVVEYNIKQMNPNMTIKTMYANPSFKNEKQFIKVIIFSFNPFYKDFKKL